MDEFSFSVKTLILVRIFKTSEPLSTIFSLLIRPSIHTFTQQTFFNWLTINQSTADNSEKQQKQKHDNVSMVMSINHVWMQEMLAYYKLITQIMIYLHV